jgi:hypothetical protein
MSNRTEKRERVSFVCANYFVHLTKYSRLEYVGREIKLFSSSSRLEEDVYYITMCACIDENVIALSSAVYVQHQTVAVLLFIQKNFLSFQLWRIINELFIPRHIFYYIFHSTQVGRV